MKQTTRATTNSPWELPLVAIILFGLGLLLLYLFGQVDTLRCQHTAQGTVDCALTTTWMKSILLSERQFSGLASASVAESCDSDGCTYKVILNTIHDMIPFSNVSTSDLNFHQRHADQINSFLQDTAQPELNIETGGGWILIVPALLLISGIALSLFNGLRLLRAN